MEDKEKTLLKIGNYQNRGWKNNQKPGGNHPKNPEKIKKGGKSSKSRGKNNPKKGEKKIKKRGGGRENQNPKEKKSSKKGEKNFKMGKKNNEKSGLNPPPRSPAAEQSSLTWPCLSSLKFHFCLNPKLSPPISQCRDIPREQPRRHLLQPELLGGSCPHFLIFFNF